MTSEKKNRKGGSVNYFERRANDDRRKLTDRRQEKDRRTGWGKNNEHLLEGAATAAATIVHQFSRPFTIIIGYVDLILSSTKEEDTKEKLEIIKNQLKLIVRILKNIRELDEYKTVDFDGLDLLDIKLEEEREDEI